MTSYSKSVTDICSSFKLTDDQINADLIQAVSKSKKVPFDYSLKNSWKLYLDYTKYRLIFLILSRICLS